MSKALGGYSQLVGHSFGGLVAREAVLTDPSVFSTITLLCSGPGAFTDQETLQGLQMLAFGLDNLPIEQVYDLKLAARHQEPRVRRSAGRHRGVPPEALHQQCPGQPRRRSPGA